MGDMKTLARMCIVLVAVVPPIHGLPQSKYLLLPALASTNETQTSLNVTPSEYPILDCGARTAEVALALDKAREAVNPALLDVHLSTRSPYGFTSLFKSSSASKPVGKMLRSIQKFESIRNRLPGRLRSSPPSFICVHPLSRLSYPELSIDPCVRVL